MEKTKWGKVVLEAFITAIITTLITFGVTAIVNRHQINITIGTSIIQENTIMTPVIINNSSKNKAVENLELAARDNKIETVKSDLAYEIDHNKNILTINYIPPKETISIILTTIDLVKPNDIKIAYAENINVTYLENPKKAYILIISYTIMYFATYMILQYAFDLKLKKYYKILYGLEEEYHKYEKKLQNLKTENTKTQEALKVSRNKIHEMRIYYITRMSDYKKELNFWKDTIRKMLYQSSKKIDTDDLFNVVTETLQTYGTKSSVDTNIDEIYYLSKLMKENIKDKG